MRTGTYNGRVLGNSLNIYNYYKQATGRGLQADLTDILHLPTINEKIDKDGIESLTEKELESIQKVDALEVIANLYVALRKGGDTAARRLSAEEIRDELTMDDINNPELLNLITELLSGKKGLAEQNNQ